MATYMFWQFFVVCLVWLVSNTECKHIGEPGICRSDADCGTSECCVGLGKKRFILVGPTFGICQPTRHQGNACYVDTRMDPNHPNLHVHMCPCDNGLVCSGTSNTGRNGTKTVHDIPKCLPVAS